MPDTMGQPGGRRQGSDFSVLTRFLDANRRPFRSKTLSGRNWATKPPRRPWLIILNILGLSDEGVSLIPGCIMRSISGLLAGVFILAASAAAADSRVFIVANQADGYGVDQCLAKGEKCGAHAALSYCQSRNFAEASSYRRVDPEEVTGTVPKSAGANCGHAGCGEYVAITCQR
jgi:hypothetical protein